jgi:beta-ribofuranosylaminobenzene 5'-phosphate synthase
MVGGICEQITAVLEEFRPGEKDFIVHPENYGISPRTVRKAAKADVEVLIPARIHSSVLDANRFSLSRPGGGGIGFAIGINFRAKVKALAKPEIIIKGKRQLIAQHFAAVFKDILQYEGGFEIEIYDHGRQHVGMGSSTGTMCAVSVGINELLGRPFNNRELRKILGYNACEESPYTKGCLVRGFETGIGAMVGINGGMVLGTDEMEMIYRTAIPDAKVIMVIPDVETLKNEYVGIDTAADHEAELLMNRARYLDSLQCGAKSQIILLELLPAMVRCDLKAIGDAIFDLMFMGIKRAECEQHGLFGANIYHYVCCLRQLGAEVAGMSSVGPTVYAITKNPKTYDSIMNFLIKNGVENNRIIQTAIDNVGVRIIENDKERSYTHEGWLQG